MANGIRTGDPCGFNKVRSSVKVPEFDKYLKKAGRHNDRYFVEIKIKTIKLRLRTDLMCMNICVYVSVCVYICARECVCVRERIVDLHFGCHET